MPVAAARSPWTTAIAVFVAVTIVTAVLSVIAVERSPLVWGDETYVASAAYSVASGGDGTPTVLAPGFWNRSFPRAYGPVFFRLSATAMRLVGVRPLGVRIVSLSGALLLPVAAFLFARSAGCPMPWAWLAAAILWLSPDLGSSATNGRMDALAVGLEFLGLAFAAMANDDRRDVRAGWSIATGVAWAGAALTTPRTYPFFAAIGLLVVFLWWRGRDRRIVAVWMAGLVMVGVAMVAWLMLAPLSPREWLGLLVAGATKDTFNGTINAPRVWGISAKTVFTPLVSVAALIAAWLFASGRGGSRWTPMLTASAWLAIAHIALYSAVFNFSFFAGIYFSLPLLAVSIAASGGVAMPEPRRRALIAVWLCVGTVCLAARTMKLVEVFETWQARDPAPLEQFVRAHVSPGALVFGYDPLYFYAVTRSGSLFRTAEAEPYPGSPTIGRRPRGTPSTSNQLRPGVVADRRFLLWPKDEATFPFPEAFACGRGGAEGTFEAARSGSNAITRLPFFARFAYLHVYQDTVVYRLPEGCPRND